MSITIHWGGNGSYKSSGVMQDYIVPAATAETRFKTKDGETVTHRGRVVVTNLRGVSRERFFEVLGDEKVLPEFDVIYIDTSTTEGREKVLRFFHWAPQGALLVFDECNMCFPPKLRESDLKLLNYKTLEEAEAENRPFDWLQAWEQHRHYNWDIVLMVPNIKSVRDDIRATAEGAYRHANLAQIGIKGRYLESYHDANNNGTSSHVISSKTKRIRKETFALYDSSKTGFLKDTLNGSAFFGNVRLLAAMGVLFICAYGVVSGLGTSAAGDVGAAILSPGTETTVVRAVSLPVEATAADAAARSAGGLRDVDAGAGGSPLPVTAAHPFAGAQLSITGYARIGSDARYMVQILLEDGQVLFHESRTLLLMGYRIVSRDRCLFTLAYGDFEQSVFCRPRTEALDEGVPDRGEAPGLAGL